MSNYNKIAEKFPNEIVYLEISFEEIALKRMPGAYSKTYAKPKNRNEYEIKSSSILVTETYFEAKEITKEQYENY